MNKKTLEDVIELHHQQGYFSGYNVCYLHLCLISSVVKQGDSGEI
ncbi:hypothetical protein [Nicoletella semolina]|nr:hypothetical protein [Nicoletella semolina]